LRPKKKHIADGQLKHNAPGHPAGGAPSVFPGATKAAGALTAHADEAYLE